MSKHALLSASSSKMWINCTPSAKLCAVETDRASPYAKQGTDAHSLCEYKILTKLGRSPNDPTEHLEFYDAEMEECATEYCNYVMQQYEEAKSLCKDPEILIEEHLDFSKWVPEGFGTGDCVIVADDLLQVTDFKFGVGILVDADKNPQMMCYALGALDLYDGIYDIKTIKMTIFQPRRENVSTFTLSKEELLDWADNVLAPAASLAFKGEGEFKAGEHCQFCKVKATCRERAEHNLQLAKYDFRKPVSLSDKEIADILKQSDEFLSWLGDVKDHALTQALNGIKYDGFKVVEGRSNRKYLDEQAVASAVTKAGFDPYERKLLGITAMTSLLGKNKFNELLSEYIIKPQGKPTLVPDTDKRPALNTAKDDFNEK